MVLSEKDIPDKRFKHITINMFKELEVGMMDELQENISS